MAKKKSASGAGRKLKVEVELQSSGRRMSVGLEAGATGQELLRVLGLHLDAHILVRDNAPIPIDDKLKGGDRIKILTVASGG